jgi:hypothetical protein
MSPFITEGFLNYKIVFLTKIYLSSNQKVNKTTKELITRKLNEFRLEKNTVKLLETKQSNYVKNHFTVAPLEISVSHYKPPFDTGSTTQVGQKHHLYRQSGRQRNLEKDLKNLE